MTMDEEKWVKDAADTISQYVQFDTTNPPGNEMPAALWLKDQIEKRGITSEVSVFEPEPGRGLVFARIAGTDNLKPLMLNHHIDVVAADARQWTHPPFSGTIKEGYVWGRGTLDTKGLGVCFLLALESLIKENFSFRRPVIFTAVPDEEPGGDKGMRWLVENHLKIIDPEWVWDEGSGGLKNVFGNRILFAVAVAEKQVFRARLIARGEPGHGSMPHPDSANVILLKALNRISEHPRPMRLCEPAASMFSSLANFQPFPPSFILKHLSNPLVMWIARKALSADRLTNALLRDTVSINVIKGGYQINVIPERAEAELDCRLLPDTEAEEFRRWLVNVIADKRIEMEMIQSSSPSGMAPLGNPFYRAVENAISRHVPDSGVFPLLMAGATDGRYFRERGYPAYGFAPFILDRSDLSRIHGIDERISLENIRLGLKIVRDVIKNLCS